MDFLLSLALYLQSQGKYYIYKSYQNGLKGNFLTIGVHNNYDPFLLFKKISLSEVFGRTKLH
jgi:hypothetical protein